MCHALIAVALVGCTRPPSGEESVASRESALLATATVDEHRVGAAHERLEDTLLELEPSARLLARAERLDAEIASLREDPDLDSATMRATAAAIRARFYEDVPDDELAHRPSWAATDDDRRNAAALEPLLGRRPTTAPDLSLLTPDDLAGEAVAPPTLEELMRAPVPTDVEERAEEVSHED